MYAKVNAATITGSFALVSESAKENGVADVVSVYSPLDQDVVLRLHGGQGNSDVLVPAQALGMVFPSSAGSISIQHTGSAPASGAIVINRYKSGV